MNKRLFWVAATAVFPLFALFVWLQQTAQANSLSGIVIDAVLYDGQLNGDTDEALRLRNVTDIPIMIGEWKITDGEATAVLPPGITLNAGETVWLARYGDAFRRSFGFDPDFELNETNAAIPNLIGSWTRLANGGDQVMLRNETNLLVDC
ncbi:MAG: lamin tail domain-containing protein, partial [Chloroflexi bacterium]|nr:lamin tail domain-containing protein [Chloroflexota bacterium]